MMAEAPTTSPEALNVAREVLDLVLERPAGLLLVCGPHDSGKSTTLAALLDWLTRVLGRHTAGVLLVDETDETTSLDEAIQKAEEGRLVLAAVRARTALSALGHLIERKAPVDGPSLAGRLADNLIGIVCQCLLVRASGNERVPAFEVLPVTPAVQYWIRQRSLSEIPGFMEMSSSRKNLRLMNDSLASLVLDGSVTREVALLASPSPEDLTYRLGRAAGLRRTHR
jgi:twitching motility protein PilT